MLLDVFIVALQGLVLTLLGVVFSILPGGVGLSLSGGIVVGYTFLNTFLPVAETLAAISFLVGMWGLLFGYRVLREALGMIPVLWGGS